MASGKTVKLVLYELLQFVALTVPIFVIMERFGRLIREVRGGDHTAYWLVVAASIAYVTSVTLLVWVPVKYLSLKRRGYISEITQWRPTVLAHVILCTFPCFAILIVSSKVQVDAGRRLDHFSELPVSLVLFALVCVDVIERLRPCRLIGHSDSLDPYIHMTGPVLTHLHHVTTVTDQLQADTSQTDVTSEVKNGSASSMYRDSAGSSASRMRATGTTYLYSPSQHLRPRAHSGRLGFLWRKDARAEVFMEGFVFWLDTVEMVRVAGEPSVFYSAWVFPVYILAFLSTLRAAITPNNPLLSFAGFALQDVPFFVLRVALIAVFGYLTSVFYPLKNVLISITFIYFTFLAKLRIFKRHSLF
ncbi:transmembrane protein 236 [Takifugu rubripes]|uniref:Transmembrane protein 236 n=1 Tax=Takifugu flavidus TaxID=433684 RepID=A0A5C6P640_9TELE|nr:transmembrane protein 236-like [Takifugu rubripes]XP_056913702.1 transmembrane protein 236 [Takifugu flavidus]TWW73597.1 Transmembrane protein 236 [Takifugu flavidus]|eukprot:XP_003975517.1 PREDICTED: transmembrane protein 236-like [Takifugu rubripes]